MNDKLRDAIAERIYYISQNGGVVDEKCKDEADAILALPEMDRMTKKCKWRYTGDKVEILKNCYITPCGTYYSSLDNFKFCPFCGKEIKVVKE